MKLSHTLLDEMQTTSIIRAMTSEDLEMVLRWRNHPRVRSCMFNTQEIGLEEHQKWFETATSNPSRRLMIVGEHKPFGFVQFKNIIKKGIADWGFYVDPSAARGSGKKLGELALNYAFDSLELHKVCGQALLENTSSIKLHQYLGFKEEGVLREQQRCGDRYCSVVCFGILDHEWKERTSR